jgi:hypothetical protein
LRSNYVTRLLPYLVLAVLAILFFHKLAFSGLILGRGDVYTYFYPYWTERHEALREGHIPLWTTDLFMGSPLLANSQMGLFYPFNWPLTPLDAPTAITVSLLAHVIWGLWGAYRLGRARLRLGVMPALLAAVLFGLSGYLGAKAENINQLQALAWMPWVFLWYLSPPSDRVGATRRVAPTVIVTILQVGIGVALQLLAGHPQTVFITLVGLGVVALAPHLPLSSRLRRGRGGWGVRFPLHYLRGLIGRLLILLAAVLLALLLAAPQLVPTAELSGQSNRGGGLNPQQATAFSLNPALIGRGFLPAYDALVFGEYTAWLGVIGLGLAVLGATSYQLPASSQKQSASASSLVTRHSSLSILPFLLLAVVGLFLALGEFNPLYWLLAQLPGFSYFRVPARWLALFALGAAMLAGYGAQVVQAGGVRRWQIALMGSVLGVLAGSSLLAGTMPMDVIGPATPTLVTWIGWAVAGGALFAGIFTTEAQRTQRKHRGANQQITAEGQRSRGTEGDLTQRGNPTERLRSDAKRQSLLGLGTPFMVSAFRASASATTLLVIAAVIEVFLASRVMAYNELVPPDTYTASRFTINQLAVLTADETPPGRFLSISAAQFDPGDNTRLIDRYRAAGMSDFAIRLALVDTKLREVIAANLPLTWNLPSIDGFDGGLLPVGAYTAFTSLMLPPDQLRTIDGRLREILARPACGGACIPDQRWLNLTGTRYLITDKVFDRVADGIFYDTTFEVRLAPQEQTLIATLPAFESTGLNLLYTAEAPCEGRACWPTARLTYADGTQETLSAREEPSALDEFALLRLTLNTPRTPTGITLRAGESALTLRAASLVDERTGDFQQLTLGAWTRRLSSDIKLYEQTTPLVRAFVVNQIEAVPDNWDGQERALLLMRDPDFDPFRQAVIATAPGIQPTIPAPDLSGTAQVTFTDYQPESMRLRVETDSAGYLVITDTFYPGWQASVNGQPAPIYRADVLFRGIPVPAGASEVILQYAPGWWPGALAFGAAGWLLAFVGWFVARRRVVGLFGAV